MLAIFKTGGKQYSVKTGQILKVEKLDGKKGDSVSFKDVLVISDALNHTIGTPIVQGANVKAKILNKFVIKKLLFSKNAKDKIIAIPKDIVNILLFFKLNL